MQKAPRMMERSMLGILLKGRYTNVNMSKRTMIIDVTTRMARKKEGHRCAGMMIIINRWLSMDDNGQEM